MKGINKMNDAREKKGFTLIEVLGVIIILAIITSIGLFVFSNVSNESKEIVSSVTRESIEEAALSYAKEFKLEERFWYDKEGSTSGEKFTCTTIKQLVDTGYLPKNPVDATTGEKYDDITTIMIERDANKVLSSSITLDAIECDNSPPKVEITFTGTNVTDLNNNKWYNNENDATVTIKPIVGISGVAEYEYFIKDSKGRTKTILKGNDKKDYEGKIIDIIGKYTTYYGKDVKVCAKIRNGNDLEIEGGEYCESVNLDFTKPIAPILTASDNITSGNWHKSNFNINISGGGTSPSGIYYLYGIDNNDVNEKIIDNKIGLDKETGGSKYKFITCNNAGTCSESADYYVKLDKTAPVITKFISLNEEKYIANVPLEGTSQDILSGITKYKFDKSSTYNNNGWISVDNTTETITLNGEATSNGKIYLWVQDKAGNYASKNIDISNCGKLYTKNVTAYSEDGSTITDSINISGILKLYSITVNTGYVENSSLSGNKVSYTLKGASAQEGTYQGSCYTTPTTYTAHTDRYCSDYYCPRGGSVSGSRCVGSTYKEESHGTATYSCDCSSITHKYMNCGGGSATTVSCDEGYSNGGYVMKPSSVPRNGQSCSRDYSVERYGVRTCVWNGNYSASCRSYDTDYYCDSGDVLKNKTCYTCSRGTINSSGSSCKYSCTKYFDYWEYKVEIKYYA